MHKSLLFYLFLVLNTAACHGQSTVSTEGMVKEHAFDKELKSLLSFKTPIISVSQAKKLSNVVYLDAREIEEYQVSHIPGAKHIGYKDWDSKILNAIPKDQSLIVYCSVGYRSEKIGEKIIKLGYKNVKNLYGSIFEWTNAGYALEQNGQVTSQLHTYNAKWGQWVTNDKIIRVN